MKEKQKPMSQRRAEFVAELFNEQSPPPQRKKTKSVNLERMADLYLAGLAKGKREAVFLNDFLEDRGIYFTGDSIQACLDLLLEKRFIALDLWGFSTFNIAQAASIWGRRRSKAWKVPLCHITDEGLHFVKGDQEIDAPGRESRLAEKKKWRERFISLGTSVVVGIILMIAKWFFIDKK